MQHTVIPWQDSAGKGSIHYPKSNGVNEEESVWCGAVRCLNE